MIAAILLAASGAADFGRSPFVDRPHEHAWELLGEEEAGRAWWDRNYRRTRSVDEREYPAMRVRVVADKDHFVSKLFRYQDIVWALDCATREIAEVEEIANGQAVADPWADLRGSPQFRPLPDQESDAVRSMIRVVCGENGSS